VSQIGGARVWDPPGFAIEASVGMFSLAGMLRLTEPRFVRQIKTPWTVSLDIRSLRSENNLHNTLEFQFTLKATFGFLVFVMLIS
jgi:hypothetical protein